MKTLIITIVLIATMATSVCAADKWTPTDTAWQVATMATFALDWAQTKEIARDSRYYETNKILGRNPSQNAVDTYFAGYALIHTGIAYVLPKPYRRYWQMIFITTQSCTIYSNHSIGIRIDF